MLTTGETLGTDVDNHRAGDLGRGFAGGPLGDDPKEGRVESKGAQVNEEVG